MSWGIIAGLHTAAQGYISPELEKFGRYNHEEITQQESLEKLLEPLSLEQADQILSKVADLTAADEANSFQNGFRLGVRLMLECLEPGERREST